MNKTFEKVIQTSDKNHQHSEISSKSNLSPRHFNLLPYTSKQHANHFQYNSLYLILQKQHSLRTHNQLKFINQFIKKNIALKQLSDINGPQFCKGIMRSAFLEEFAQFQVVQQKGTSSQFLRIVLDGKLRTIKNQDETDMIQQLKTREVYQILMKISRKEMKKKSKLTNQAQQRQNYLNSKKHQKCIVLQSNKTLENIQKGQIFGDKLRCSCKQALHTTVAMVDTIFLSINFRDVFYWLNHAFQLKLEKTYKILKNHPCFNYLQNDILEQIIGYMSHFKKTKNQIIYQEDSQSTHIYFLEQGELKIEKEYDLFVTNPNDLYMDRRKLMSQRQLCNKQFLPYANLENLYNYRPNKKIVQLGVLTPFCLFGEEQIIQNRRRETTTRCSSLYAVYYGIQISNLFQTLGQSLAVFLQGLKQFTKSKIIYRQNMYGNAIDLGNKNNLKYFYLQENQMQISTPRKYIIRKINERMNLNEKNYMPKILQYSKLETQTQSNLTTINHDLDHQIYNPEITNEKQEKEVNTIPPLYNTFNFHKMLKTKLIKTNHSLIKLDDSLIKPSLDKLHVTDEDKQYKIIANSHTWRLVKQKVKVESRISKKIGSYKHDINFITPLIDEKYFRNIDSELKKLERDKKIGKFNLSLRNKNTMSPIKGQN